MKKNVNGKRKLNNAGLTLVEIIVAFAIMAIAIVPLMYGFVYSAKNNAKAKHMQQTSILAHTIIENCKAYNMDEIKSMISTNTFLPDASASIDGTVMGSSKLEYYFDNVNIYEDELGNASTQIYDVKMTIEPYGSSETMTSFNNMNPYKDAIFMAEKTLSTGSYAGITAKEFEREGYADYVYDWVIGIIETKVNNDSDAIAMSTDDIKNSFKTGGLNAGNDITFSRKIVVTAGKSGTTETVNVHYQYTYELESNFKYQANDTSTTPATIVEKTVNCNDSTASLNADFKIYENTDPTEDARLENIYLYYYPTYNSSDLEFSYATDYDDGFEFKNDLGRCINIYLLKQIRPDMTLDEVEDEEKLYRPYITGTSGGKQIFLYTNLYENIGKAGEAKDWLPSYINASDSVIKPIEFSSSTIAVPESMGDTINEPLIYESNEQLMYTVLVEIFDRDSYKEVAGVKQMTTSSLAKMGGTFLNW